MFKLFNNLLFERSYPYLGGVAALFIWLLTEVSLPEEKDILSSTLTISAILTGFLATSKALLMSIGSDTMTQIKNSSYGSSLISYFGEAILFSFLTCIVSLTGYFIDIQNVFFGSLWITAGTITIFCFARISVISLKILSN